MSDEQLKPSPVRISPDLPQTPAAQERVNDLFRGYVAGSDGHVANKVLDALFDPKSLGRTRPTNWTSPRPLPEECNFGVIQKPQFNKPNETVTRIVVDLPNPDPEWTKQQPRIEEEVSFGLQTDRFARHTMDDPQVLLTNAEMEIVNEALKVQQAEKGMGDTK